MFKCAVVFFTLTDRASTVPSKIYVVANPVRGLLDRKRSEEHLQSSNESKIKNKTKNKNKQNRNDKKKGTITQSTCQKNIEGHSIERVWYNACRKPSDTFPGSQPSKW